MSETPREIGNPAMMNTPQSERSSRRSSSTNSRADDGSATAGRPAPPSGRSLATAFVSDEARFLAVLPFIDSVTAQVCRRNHLNSAEADDFRSDVRLHFIERNYEVLRKFEGRSQLTTYLTVVIQRLFLDRRNREWGRWRPSAEAKRLGPTGILLERLIIRDGWPQGQALELIAINYGVAIDDSLRSLGDTLAARGPARRMVSEADAGDIVDKSTGADDNVVRAEHDFLARRVQSALDRARQMLAPVERLILKMRFEDRVSVADIARTLTLDQRRLYRTIEQLLASIGASLREEGISEADITLLFADDASAWNVRRDPPSDSGSRLALQSAARKGVS